MIDLAFYIQSCCVCYVGYNLPWEDSTLTYPENFARPLDIAIEASNGASDYGNKFGEPILSGFARSFGQILPGSGERREWIKPIMFTGGIGSISDDHVNKMEPEVGAFFVHTDQHCFTWQYLPHSNVMLVIILGL